MWDEEEGRGGGASPGVCACNSFDWSWMLDMSVCERYTLIRKQERLLRHETLLLSRSEKHPRVTRSAGQPGESTVGREDVRPQGAAWK